MAKVTAGSPTSVSGVQGERELTHSTYEMHEKKGVVDFESDKQMAYFLGLGFLGLCHFALLLHRLG
jgi:hypothetical protein